MSGAGGPGQPGAFPAPALTVPPDLLSRRRRRSSVTLTVVLSLLMFAFAPGRIWGIDAWLRPRLVRAARGGSGLARLLAWLT